jgi:hypothetical protein
MYINDASNMKSNSIEENMLTIKIPKWNFEPQIFSNECTNVLPWLMFSPKIKKHFIAWSKSSRSQPLHLLLTTMIIFTITMKMNIKWHSIDTRYCKKDTTSMTQIQIVIKIWWKFCSYKPLKNFVQLNKKYTTKFISNIHIINMSLQKV